MQLKFAILALAAIPAFAGEALPPIAVQDPANLIGGPVVVNAGPKSATVLWLTKISDLGNTSDPEKLRAMVRVNTKQFTDLKPGTEYDYDFDAPQPLHAHFRTAPVGRTNFEFIVYGDTRTRDDVHQKVVDEMVKYDPQFVVHTGDFVADGTHTDLWRVFLGIEKQLLDKAAFYPCPGNHEHGAPQYFNFLAAKAHYSFDWGAAHFSVLDSDIGAVPKEQRDEYWAEQKRWLDDDLATAAKADFRFVVFHHPPFSAVALRNTNDTRELVPIFEKRGVTAVFSGHDHNYQRHFKNGIQYVVTGGAGAPLYNVHSPIQGVTVAARRAENFVRVQVNGKKATVTALGLGGQELDRFELDATGAPATAAAAGAGTLQ